MCYFKLNSAKESKMDYEQASKIIQDHTGLPLLESLEEIKATTFNEQVEFDLLPRQIKEAYEMLMAGFTKLFEG